MNDPNKTQAQLIDELMMLRQRVADLEATGTEHKHVEHALRKGEERYRSLFDGVPVGLYRTALDGQLLDVNLALVEILGYPDRGSLLATNASELYVYHEDRRQFLAQLEQQEFVRDFEMQLHRRDGTVIWVQASASATRDTNGQILHSEGHMMDITTRKQTQEALRKLSRAVEQSANTIVITDTRGSIEYVNPKFSQLTGYTFEEAIGQNPRILKSDITPPEVYDELWTTIANGGEWRGEFLNKKKNGELYWEFASISPIRDPQGNTTHYLAIKEDITARKQAEAALRESEEKYRILLDESADPIFSLASTGQYHYVNRAFAEGVGMPVEQITGHTMWDVFSQEEADKRFAALSEVFQTGVEKVIEVRVPRPDQDHFYITTITPIKDAKGGVINVICSSKNITKRKQAEEQLRQANLVVENSPTVLFRWWAEEGWPIDFVSENVVDLFGYIAEDFLSGKVLYAMTIHPDDLERITHEVQAHAESGVARFVQKYRIMTKAGEVRWIDDRTMIERDSEGRVTHYQGVIIDITERVQAEEALRESEERYQIVSELTSDYAYAYHVQPDGTLTRAWVTGAFVRITGFTDDELRARGGWESLLCPDDMPIARDQFKALMAGQSKVVEYRILTKSGELRWMRDYARSGHDEVQGRITHIFGAVQDITELKQAEAERLALVAERERVKILGDFIGAMSQEFRTPLSVINSSLYLIEKVAEPKKRAEQLDVLKGQVSHIHDLVEVMLTMSRLDSGPELDYMPLDVNGLLQDIASRLSSFAEEKQITCTKVLGDDIPLAQGDRQYFHQALTHLMHNAVQYTPPGGAVTARTYIRDEWLVVEISDTGIGISEAHLPHIFERFYRVDEARTYRGAGLGLSIAQKIVEMHGGYIEVESTLGTGSTFRALLPVNGP